MFFSIAFSTGVRRRPVGWLKTILVAYAAGTAIWTCYSAILSSADVLAITIVFLCLMLVLVFQIVGTGPNADKIKPPIYDSLASLLSLMAGVYFFTNIDVIATRMSLFDPLSTIDLFFGTILVLLALEATRRTVGLGLTLIVLVFIIYNLFGDLLSGPLTHGEITFEHFIDILVFTSDGIFNIPIQVTATYAFLFVMFGTFLERAGGGEFFFDLAATFTGKQPGGPAKIAVFSSALFGTVSGSPTSDVVTTGSVTIPIMKRLGYSGVLAAGVEVAASTGGSLLPPVMGSAAFIMAEFTGINYVDIVVAGAIPAVLYYVCIYSQVHLRSLKLGLAGLDENELPKLKETLKKGGLFIVPLIILVVALVSGYTPTYVAMFGVLSVIAVWVVRRQGRMTLNDLYEGLAQTTFNMVAVTGACAAAGLVIGGITMTGLAGKVSELVLLVAGSSLYLTLLVSAMITIILGMGMPTPAAYALAAVLLGPTLVDGLNIPVMPAHLFLLYFAVMSAMTPPVAVAAYAAAAIADANPMEIAFTAVKLSIGAFILPFAFVYGTGLLLIGSIEEILITTLSVSLAMLLVSIASEGYLRSRLPWWNRLLFAAAGIALLFPNPYTLAAGALLTGLAAFPALKTKMVKD